MFLVSFPPLVLAMCKAGIAGCLPHVNARSSEVFDKWLSEMTADLAAFARANPDLPVGPIGVNLVVHRTNPRFAADLELVVKHRVPLVLASLGHPGPVGIGRRRLSEAIEGAVASGVCGSPWFLVDGEAFFGADRLPQIAWRLSGVAPVSPA